MAHVTLIRPPVLFPKLRPNATVKAIAPIGMAYLAGTLRAQGIPVRCIDAPGEAIRRFRECELDPSLLENGLTVPEILDRIPESTDVIGLSCMFSYEWFYLIALIRAIRARFPRPLIVVGGEHVTADYDYILRTMPEVDGCVLGEGENKLLGLVQAFRDGTPKLELPGMAVLDPDTGSVRKNEEKDGQYRILDIDAIPRPAWDLLPLRAYLDEGCGFGSLHHRAMPMLASRGCPHRCTFCSSPQMWTTRWKARDVDDLVDEIKSAIREYGVNRVEFFDLTTVIDKRWILDFCRKLIDENLGITWAMPSGTRTEGLTQEVLELVKKSGCIKLTYPLETGNPRVCNLIKKNINYRRSLSSMRNAVKARIIVKVNLIIGFPFESYWDVFREYLFAIRLAWLGAHDLAFFNFAPYPGSELHNELVAQRRIVKDENYPWLLRRLFIGNYTNCLSWCPNMSGRALKLLCMLGMAQFYFFQFLFRPYRLISTVYRLSFGQPLTVFELGLTAVGSRMFHRYRFRLMGERREGAI